MRFQIAAVMMLMASVPGLAARTAAAEPPPPVAFPSSLQPLAPRPVYFQPLAPAPVYRNVAMRNAGITITVIAIAHTLLGAALMGLGVVQNQAPCISGGCADIPPGTLALVAGIGLLGTGVPLSFIGPPLWAAGSRPPAGAPYGGSTGGVHVMPTPHGLGFTF